MMKQYLKLLVRRESRELMGRRFTNLWLLTLMLIATFISIAFSEGSMNYLRNKMEDPFTNWVNISRSSDDNRVGAEEFNAFRESLNEESNKKRFGYRDVLISMYDFYNMWGLNGDFAISASFFQHLNSPLIREVVKEKNLVEGCTVDTTLLDDESMGFIITIGAAKKLGYDEKHLPAYIDVMKDNEGADSLGLRLVPEGDKYLPVSLPVIAVVHRLPGNVQMISGTFLYEQLRNGGDTQPFHFVSHSDEYLRQQKAAFFVTDSLDSSFREFVPTVVPDSLKSSMEIIENNELYHTMRPWKKGNILQVSLGDGTVSREAYQAVADAIEKQFPDKAQLCRVFLLKTKSVETPRSMYLSVEFKDLDKIHEFEEFANDHSIQLEMEQVHSKENFKAVANMAHILSAAMVIFSIICIIMFLVNMLQAYFQRVRHNIGTFKAFGMNGRELTTVYALLLFVIVLSAVALALLLTWGIQFLLPLMGVEKEGFNYLDLWNDTTYIATAVIFVSTVLTVIIVMTRMLSQTPGDLIYDRN